VELDMNFVPFAAATAAANTKQYDIVEMNTTTTAALQAQGLGTKIISTGLLDPKTTVIIVPKDSDIESPADLEGKQIGATALATTYILQTRYLLTKNFGLDTSLEGGDVKWAPIADPTTLLSTLETGGVDAVVATQASNYTALNGEDSKFKVLYPVTEEWSKLFPGPSRQTTLNIYTDPMSIDEDHIPEVVRMFAESYKYFAENKDEVVKAVATEQGIDEGLVAWEADIFQYSAGPFTDESKEWMQGIIDVAAELGVLEASVPVDDLILETS
jgi:ABC-type nitrate/sulfonate/bicarbonate transport system substrate-binding protein